MSAYAAAGAAAVPERPCRISAELQRLALIYVWITFAISGFVFVEPSPHDALLIGASIILPLVGLVALHRGLVLYLLLWFAVIVASLVASTQAGVFDVPTKHAAITAYLSLSSVVILAFVLDRPEANVRLIMSAYVAAAVFAASTGLIGYFNLVPGASELFTVDGVRASGTFKDPNVLGAFLVPPVVYVLHNLIRSSGARAVLWLVTVSVLVLATLLSFSRGAWFNLAVSVAAYAYLTFAAAGSHRRRLKLAVWVMLGWVLSLGILFAVLNVPKFAELMEERTSLQYYDVGPEGRFAKQMQAVDIAITKPLGIGALEFGRIYDNDVHQVYVSMFLNAGWVGGTFYFAAVVLTLWLGMQQVIGDRGGSLLGAVLLASFIGMAAEGAVIDTDHWRHFYLLMAMIWGLALAQGAYVPDRVRADEAVPA